jgi:integrase
MLSDFDRMLDDIEPTENFDADGVINPLFWTGLRQSDASGLRWSDWDEQSERMHVRR